MLLTPDIALRTIAQHASRSLAESTFFHALRHRTCAIEHVRAVFSQYYLWRNAFHRWFGVVIAKSPPFGVQFATDLVLSELTEHIEEEIKGDHHGMCKTFLRGLGIADPAAIRPISLTDKYIDSFVAIYMTDSSSFEEALSALAGRELCAPERNRIIIDALSSKYGIAQGLDFFRLHEELELDHFKRLWGALTSCRPKSTEALVDAAKSEITRHIHFWDDVSRALTEPRVAHCALR